jgi:Flp pilus assembly protein TadG
MRCGVFLAVDPAPRLRISRREMLKTPAIKTDENGQTMVELAIVLPVLLVLLIGIIQFGIAFNNYLTLTDAARAGARKAVVTRSASACVTQVKTSASDLKQSDLTVDCSSSWQHGEDVTVTATYPYELNVFGVVVVNGRLSTKTTERVE